MKNIVTILATLVIGIYLSGCATSSYCNANYAYLPISLFPFPFYERVIDSANNCKENAKNLEQACRDFEQYDKAKIQHKDESNLNAIIKDYKKGLLSVQINTIMNESEYKDIYCNKLEPKILSSQTKSFAVNGNGSNDFQIKITKEIINAQKVKEGKVLEKDIKMTAYKIEPIEVITYKGTIYQANSSYINNLREKLKNDYIRAEKTLRDKLPCFERSGKAYCDGDLVSIYNIPIMIRVDKAGYGTVRYELYFYQGGRPIAEANYDIQSAFRMNPPAVYANHNLKEEKLPNSHTLSVYEVKTFKEW